MRDLVHCERLASRNEFLLYQPGQTVGQLIMHLRVAKECVAGAEEGASSL
jgi:hypothetical protein